MASRLRSYYGSRVRFQVTAIALLAAGLLSACGSSAGHSPTGITVETPTNENVAIRHPSAANRSLYLRELGSLRTKLHASTNGLIGIGLVACSDLDGGADINYVADAVMPEIKTAGGNAGDAGEVVGAAIASFCPKYVGLITHNH